MHWGPHLDGQVRRRVIPLLDFCLERVCARAARDDEVVPRTPHVILLQAAAQLSVSHDDAIHLADDPWLLQRLWVDVEAAAEDPPLLDRVHGGAPLGQDALVPLREALA
eukprot:8070382-Pyramimonas_sp.AAC.1